MGTAKASVAAVLIWGLSSPSALAQTTSTSAAAQALFDEAKALMAAGKAAEACPKLEESERLAPASGTMVNLARCYELTGRLASAWAMYLEGAGAAKGTGNTERARVAREVADALAPRLARLRLVVPADARVPGLEVTKDGAVVGTAQWGVAVPEDEGEHRIAAKAPGFEPWTQAVTVAGEGSTAVVSIPKLQAARATTVAPSVVTVNDAGGEPSSGLGGQRVVALVAGGVGVAGLAVGGVFALRTLSKKKDAERYCDGGACFDHRGVVAGEDAHAAATVATIGGIVGLAGVAAGLTLWFTAKGHEPRTEIGLGPGNVEVRGTW